MAYNYEYPYVDASQYNSDWLINEWKNLRAEWDEFNTDVVGKWDKFLIDAKNQYEAFVEQVQNIQHEFEQDMETRWTDYQTQLNKAWSDYQGNLDAEWYTFRESMSSELTQFEAAMENKFTAFITNQNSKWEEFKNDILGEVHTFESNVNTRITQFEDSVNTDIVDMIADIAQFKEYVNNWINNLDITAEVSAKVYTMVSNGQFANITNPQTIAAANAWLGSHISNPSNPPLDSSLTLLNTAADSMRTGYRVFPLLKNCDLYISTEDFTLNETVISQSTGATLPSTYFDTTERFFFPAEKGQYIYAVISPAVENKNYSIAFYDYDYRFLSGYIEQHDVTTTAPVRKIPVPVGTAYVRACMSNEGSGRFACIVGESDRNMKNFMIRSRFPSATPEQQAAIDTDNGMVRVSGNHNTIIWEDFDYYYITDIDLYFILDTIESAVEQVRLAIYGEDNNIYFIRFLANRISILNTTDEVGFIALNDHINGKHHIKMIYNALGLSFYADGILLGSINIIPFKQIGIYLTDSSNTHFNYAFKRYNKPKKIMILECYTTEWVQNVGNLLTQLDELHYKYDLNVVIAVTLHSGNITFESMDSNYATQLRYRRGWLSVAPFRIDPSHNSMNYIEAVESLNAIISKLGSKSLSPYLCCFKNNMRKTDFDRLVSERRIKGALTTFYHVSGTMNFGLDDEELNVLKNVCVYKDFQRNIDFYESVAYTGNTNEYNLSVENIHNMQLNGHLNTFVFEAVINGNSQLQELTLERIAVICESAGYTMPA